MNYRAAKSNTRSGNVIVAASLALTTIMQVFGASYAFAAPTAVSNPSLETLTGGVPTCFEQSGWGNNTVTWSNSTDAHTGTNSQSLKIANYVSGDRKLLISETANCGPAVVPGQTYTVGLWYKSTAVKNNLTIFRHSTAGWTYWTDLTSLPATTAWTQAIATTQAVPTGTDQITFGMSIAGNGTLLTDDYSFVNASGGSTTTGELMQNPGLEQTAGNVPANWMLAGWGDGTVTAGNTTDAYTGTNAYKITLANRTNGDYKLLSTDATAPAVIPGQKYALTVYYKSTVQSQITLFTHSASGWAYWTDVKALAPIGVYTQASVTTPVIPAGVDQLSWGVSLATNGTLQTDAYSMVQVTSTPPPTTTEATQGSWAVLDYNIPIRAIHSTLLKNGKVLLIAGSGNSVENFNAGSFKAAVWDPVANSFTTLDVPSDMFCSGHVTLPDGKVLIQGGTSSYPTDPLAVNYGGIKDSYIFDPDTNTFTRTNDANEGHWYPTLTELGSGDIWMAGGLKADTTGAVNTETFSFAQKAWLPTNQVPQSWKFWGLYPHMFLMADGRLFYSGGHVFGNGLPGTGASIYNPSTAVSVDIPGLRNKDMRDQAASILLPPAQDQKVMITGGGNITTQNLAINSTDIIDLKAANPTYTAGPDLPGPGKMYINSTILPDRTVFMSNGAQLNRNPATNVMTAHVYNPATNTWAVVAADPIGRQYHSSSITLPDGRVAVFGSNPADGSFELRISVYSPTYLYKTARPLTAATPVTATYGQTINFNVTTSGTKQIKWAQLLRPMSATHQSDPNLRLVDLPFTVNNGVVSAAITTNRNLLPPGPYMLQVVDTDGIPSVGQWVTIN